MAWMVRGLTIGAAAVLMGAAPAPQGPAPNTAPQTAPQAARTAAPQTDKAPPPFKPRTGGYLAEGMPDSYRILPPAPVPGTTRYEADRTMFLQTRRYEGSARWKLAQNDDKSAAILADLACALGVQLTPQNAPNTVRMLGKVGVDASNITNWPKDIYGRQRPYLIDEGPICIDKSAGLAKSPDYPSGHNTWSWAVGLLMAEASPDRATEILVRARAFGESRLICGVHNMSAVEAGRTNGSILVAGLHGREDFRRDLDAVRQEIAAARKAGPAPDAAACKAEADLTTSPY